MHDELQAGNVLSVIWVQYALVSRKNIYSDLDISSNIQSVA